jgi:hypothetical protein
MNYEATFTGGREAKLRYLDADYQVVVPGDFVRCAVTGQAVPLEELRYWSVARQEAYATAEVATRRYIETERRG